MRVALNQEALKEPVANHLRHDFTMLQRNQTIGEALASLRDQPVSDKIQYFYVVDEERHLVGIVPARRLLTSKLENPISSVMEEKVVSVRASASVLHATETIVNHKLLAVPVVDEENRLAGVVDISLFTDEVAPLAQQRQMENIFQMIGAHVALGRGMPAWRGFKDRFPWLLCNIASGVLCAFVAGLHASLISEFTVLAVFVAAILALAESVSMQSMTVALQTVSSGGRLWPLTAGTMRRELLVALLLGIGSGLLVGLSAFAWGGNALASAVIGASICLSMLTACLLGVLVPVLVHAFRADPKIASGPVVLAIADVATLLFYFNIAAWALHP